MNVYGSAVGCRLSSVLGKMSEKLRFRAPGRANFRKVIPTIAATRKQRYNVLRRNPTCTLLSQGPRMPLATRELATRGA